MHTQGMRACDAWVMVLASDCALCMFGMICTHLHKST